MGSTMLPFTQRNPTLLRQPFIAECHLSSRGIAPRRGINNGFYRKSTRNRFACSLHDPGDRRICADTIDCSIRYASYSVWNFGHPERPDGADDLTRECHFRIL